MTQLLTSGTHFHYARCSTQQALPTKDIWAYGGRHTSVGVFETASTYLHMLLVQVF